MRACELSRIDLEPQHSDNLAAAHRSKTEGHGHQMVSKRNRTGQKQHSQVWRHKSRVERSNDTKRDKTRRCAAACRKCRVSVVAEDYGRIESADQTADSDSKATHRPDKLSHKWYMERKSSRKCKCVAA